MTRVAPAASRLRRHGAVAHRLRRVPQTVAVPVYADQKGWIAPGSGEQTFIPSRP